MTMTNDIPDGVRVLKDLRYGSDHERQALDLYVPVGAGPWPVIVWVHGGAFRTGSKDGPLPAEYLRQGFAIASLNYRLSQHAIWPAQIVDCKAAVRWLRSHAALHDLDPQRFVAWGTSAGGHLVAVLGVSAKVTAWDQGAYLEQSCRVQGVVDWFGPTDFMQMDVQRLPEGQEHDLADSPESELVGGAIQEHPGRVAAANPITYVSSDAPPFLIVHGEHDPLVPHHQSVLLEAALRSAGVPVQFYTVPDGGHGGFTDPLVFELTHDYLTAFRAGSAPFGRLAV